jgi:hypothetical protein
MKKVLPAAILAIISSAVTYAGPLEQLTGGQVLPSENTLDIPAAQSPCPAQGRLAALPDLGSEVYIPRENLALYPEEIEEIPLINPSVFTGTKSPFTNRISEIVAEILAINTRSDPYAAVYNAMYNAWQRGILIKANKQGFDFEKCVQKPDVLAFTYVGTEKIYMCRLLVERMNTQDTAQTLIHETAHVIGYDNECGVTKLEMTAMRKAGMKPYRNGYADKCGL